MKYTVKKEEHVSNSAFIYYLHPPALFGCYISILTNHDEELRSRSGDYSFNFQDLEFEIRNKLFTLQENKKFLNSCTLEQKLEQIKEERRDMNWNCIELDDVEELNPAVESHFNEYKSAIYIRVQSNGNNPGK